MKQNGDKGYNRGAYNGFMKSWYNYLGFDHLIPFNGSRKLA
jgi:hypothetical protein